MTPKELYDWAVESGCENYRHLQNMLDGAMTKPAGASKQKR